MAGAVNLPPYDAVLPFAVRAIMDGADGAAWHCGLYGARARAR